jgi:capsular exopolysaccharide synthesis family protein
MTELTFDDALRLARRWWWILVLLPLVAAVAAYAISTTMTPMYESRATLLIETQQASGSSNYNELLAAERLSRTYSELATTDAVLDETVIRLNDPELDRDTLAEMTSVSAVQDTQLLRVTVRDSEPERAALVANTIAAVFTEQVRAQRTTSGSVDEGPLGENIAEVRDQMNETVARIGTLESSPNLENSAVQTELQQLRTLLSSYQTTYAGLLEIQQRFELAAAESAVQIFLVNPASPQLAPVSPRVPLNVALGMFLGLVLAAGLVVLLGYLDNTVKTAEDVQRITGRAAIGMIPQLESPGQIEPIVNPRSPSTEAYRGLRTNLQFASIGQNIKSLVITSSGPSEGKSTTVMNLGVVLAQSGQRVILIDADLRRPTLHKLGELNNRAGLTNMLIADAGSEVFLYCQKTDIPSLLVVPTGPLPPNPADVLNSPRMGEIINQLKSRADIVLIDTPPLVFSDAQIVSGWTDASLLVTQAGRTRSNDLREVTKSLDQVGSHILGVVINRINFGRAEYRRREYYTTYYNADPETANLGGMPVMPAKKKWFGLTRS